MRINRIMGRDHVKHELYGNILDNYIKCRKQKSRFISSDNEQGWKNWIWGVTVHYYALPAMLYLQQCNA